MKIIRGLNTIKNIEPTSLTIGNFDGVHLGHQKIIDKVKEKAEKNNLKSAILTFYPHPIKYFKPELSKNFLINNLAQKLKFFKQNSIDYVFLIHFDQDFSEITSDDFLTRILVQALEIRELTIGYDFIFGKNRKGNFDFLAKNSEKFNFNIEQIDENKIDGMTISSSNIRNFLKNGEIKKANQFLNKNYEVKGIIINGEKIGREVGFRTANIRVNDNLILPKFGVYKSEIFIPKLNKKFKSITNFGIRPTFNDKNEPLFETHIFDYDYEKFGDLYYQNVNLELIDFIREENKFDSIEDLKKQIEKDIIIAKS